MEPMDSIIDEASAQIEFRCTRCWNSNVADCSASGSAFECLSCGHSLKVPEATPERIARAKSLIHELPPVANPERRAQFNADLSDRDLIRLANEELRVPLEQQNFADHRPASLWARFFAQVIDSLLFCGVLILACFLTVMLVGKDIERAHPASLSLTGRKSYSPILVLHKIQHFNERNKTKRARSNSIWHKDDSCCDDSRGNCFAFGHEHFRKIL